MNDCLFSYKSFYDPYGIRTRVTAVKGRCLNRLTKGPIMAPKVGLEPTTDRLTADCSTAELSRNKTVFWRPVPESNRCTRICSPLHEPLCQPANPRYQRFRGDLYIYMKKFERQYIFFKI